MEGKLIRKYRDIFARVPKNKDTIKDIIFFLEKENNGGVEILGANKIQIGFRNLLQKTNGVDWLRSRGVRHIDIDIQNNNIIADIGFCSYLQCVVEYVMFLQENQIEKEYFHKSMYSTENSRDILTEKKYKYQG